MSNFYWLINQDGHAAVLLRLSPKGMQNDHH